MESRGCWCRLFKLIPTAGSLFGIGWGIRDLAQGTKSEVIESIKPFVDSLLAATFDLSNYNTTVKLKKLYPEPLDIELGELKFDLGKSLGDVGKSITDFSRNLGTSIQYVVWEQALLIFAVVGLLGWNCKLSRDLKRTQAQLETLLRAQEQVRDFSDAMAEPEERSPLQFGPRSPAPASYSS